MSDDLRKTDPVGSEPDADRAAEPTERWLGPAGPAPLGPLAPTLRAANVEARATLPASPRAARPAPDPPPAEAARFAEERELGRGGMGRVALARDRFLDREVAIKQALSDDPAFILRFSREVRLTARLEHPSIVPVHDAGLDANGRPYYVMRRVEGEPLDVLVRRTSSAADRLALVPHVLAAADAAAYAHAKGILHRDIKPTNILVGRYGETWLIDWGLARDLADLPADSAGDGAPAEPDAAAAGVARSAPPDSGLTRAGEIMGTPGFVAPEQARGETVGVAADVYSLGATLAYVLTGQLLYPERAATGLLQRAAANAPIQLGALGPEVPPALLAIVRAATASRVEDRYGSASELATELRRFLTGQLVAAHRYSKRERLRRFARRHRAALAIGAVAAVAVTTVAVASILQIVDERDRATAAEATATGQRHLAESRSEQLLLERARLLADSDPPAAVATLQALPPGSALWPQAWGVAAKAHAAGVSVGLTPHRANVFAMEFSPDGARLATGGDDGLVLVHDVSTRAARVVANEDTRVHDVAWLGDGWLAYATAHALVTVELASARAHRLPMAAAALQPVRGGARLRFVADQKLYELERGREPAVIAPAAREAFGHDAGTVVATEGELVWVDLDGRARTLGPYREPYLIAAISPAGDRVVYSTMTQVRELALADGEVLRTWPQRKITALAWDTGGLCMSTFRESWLSTTDDLAMTKIDHVGQVRVLAARPAGCVFVEQSGSAVLIDAHRKLPVRARPQGVRQGAASRRGHAFAVSIEGGGLELWPMTHVPQTLPLAALIAETRAVNVVTMTATKLYFHDHHHFHMMDRATAEVRRLAELELSAQLGISEVGDRVVVFDFLMNKLAVLSSNAGGPAPRALLQQIDLGLPVRDRDGAWLLARGPKLSLFRPETLAERPVAQVDGAVVLLAVNQGFALAVTKTAAHRIALDTGQMLTLPIADVRTTAIDADGTAWLSTATGGVRWDGRTRTELPQLDPNLRVVLHHSLLGLVARHRSGALLLVDARGAATRTFELPPSAVLSHRAPAAFAFDEVREHLLTFDLLGGEQVRQPLTHFPSMGFVVDDEGAVAVTNLGQGIVSLHPAPPPWKPSELQAWLRSVTNAEPALTPSSPRWKLPPTTELRPGPP